MPRIFHNIEGKPLPALCNICYQEFNPRLSKPILDEIDGLLAQHYGFTNEELDFIINYDIKYRMGMSAEQAGPGGDAEEE